MRKNPLNLIKVLRIAANKLESGETKYDWGRAQNCNCGVVAQLIVPKGLMSKISGAWSNLAKWVSKSSFQTGWEQRACSATGMPLKEVFDILLENGFEYEDFRKLEFLADKGICDEAGLVIPEAINKRRYYDVQGHFANKENVIKYLRAWANILCREQCELKEQPHEQEIAAGCLDVAGALSP